MPNEKRDYTPGKIKVIMEITVTGDSTFEVDVKLDRELQVNEKCGVAAYLTDEEKVTDDISKSELVQAIAHTLNHEVEEYKEKAKNLPN